MKDLSTLSDDFVGNFLDFNTDERTCKFPVRYIDSSGAVHDDEFADEEAVLAHLEEEEEAESRRRPSGGEPDVKIVLVRSYYPHGPGHPDGTPKRDLYISKPGFDRLLELFEIDRRVLFSVDWTSQGLFTSIDNDRGGRNGDDDDEDDDVQTWFVVSAGLQLIFSYNWRTRRTRAVALTFNPDESWDMGLFFPSQSPNAGADQVASPLFLLHACFLEIFMAMQHGMWGCHGRVRNAEANMNYGMDGQALTARLITREALDGASQTIGICNGEVSSLRGRCWWAREMVRCMMDTGRWTERAAKAAASKVGSRAGSEKGGDGDGRSSLWSVAGVTAAPEDVPLPDSASVSAASAASTSSWTTYSSSSSHSGGRSHPRSRRHRPSPGSSSSSLETARTGGTHSYLSPSSSYQSYLVSLHNSMIVFDSRIENFLQELDGVDTRLKSLSTLVFYRMAHKDAEDSITLTKASTELAAAARRDSSSMKTIAVVTMAFLPATFFATVFALPSLNWGDGGGNDNNYNDGNSDTDNDWDRAGGGGDVLTRQFMIYLACALPSTVLVFVIWGLLNHDNVVRRWLERSSEAAAGQAERGVRRSRRRGWGLFGAGGSGGGGGGDAGAGMLRNGDAVASLTSVGSREEGKDEGEKSGGARYRGFDGEGGGVGAAATAGGGGGIGRGMASWQEGDEGIPTAMTMVTRPSWGPGVPPEPPQPQPTWGSKRSEA